MENKENTPRLKHDGGIQIHGKDVATYDGMLDYAHKVGIQRLENKILQFPSPENGQTAICSATLVTVDNRVFTDIGDVNPENVPRGCTANYIRMASTRAKGRVLSDAINISSVLSGTGKEAEGPIDVEFQEIPPSKTLVDGTMQGGGNKPVSKSQLRYIAKLGQTKNKDAEKLSQENFSCSLDSLTGGQAHILIKQLEG